MSDSSQRGRLIGAISVAAIVLAGTVLAGIWALSTEEWRVMTDELGYVKSGLSMVDNWSLDPSIREVPSHNYGILYPGLLAPLLGLFDMPTAFRLAHGLGALLMASTAVPTYLLGAYVSRSRATALVATVPVVLVPWVLLSMNLLTEVVAYPAFVWAVYASVRAVAEPAPRWDVLALGALVVAFLARTQFIFMFALLPLMVVLHELGMRFSGRAPRAWARQLLSGLRAAVTSHVVLTVVVGAGLLLFLIEPARLPLGDYSAVRSSKLLPPGFIQSSFDHLNSIAFGIAVVPLVLAVAYVIENVVRPEGRRAHALAVHLLLVVPAMLVVVTDFDLGFGGAGVNERYLFYIAPLLMVGAASYVLTARRPLVVVLGTALLAGLALTKTTFVPTPDNSVYGSPARSGWVALDGHVKQVGSLFGVGAPSNGLVLGVGAGLAALLLAWLIRSGHRRVALFAFGVGVGLWCLVLTVYVAPKVQAEHESFAIQALGSVPPIAKRDWIDAAVTDSATVALLPSVVNARDGKVIPMGTVTDQGVWWQAEFWNKSVRRSYLYGSAADYTPYAKQTMRLDRRTGRLIVTGGEAPYVVAARSNVLVGMEGRTVASNPDLLLRRPRRPYRASWASSGVSNDGVLAPGGASVAVFGGHDGTRRSQRLRLSFAGQSLASPLRVRGGGSDRMLRVFGRATVSARFCVPSAGSRALRMRIPGATKVRLIGVEVKMGGAC